jgi:hypothetical protein
MRDLDEATQDIQDIQDFQRQKEKETRAEPSSAAPQPLTREEKEHEQHAAGGDWVRQISSPKS